MFYNAVHTICSILWCVFYNAIYTIYIILWCVSVKLYTRYVLHCDLCSPVVISAFNIKMIPRGRLVSMFVVVGWLEGGAGGSRIWLILLCVYVANKWFLVANDSVCVGLPHCTYIGVSELPFLLL